MLLQKAAAVAADGGFWKGTAAAWLTLAGVVVGGMLQLASATLVAQVQRKQKLSDDKAERERKAGLLEAERDYVRAMLARHLESYAHECTKVKWHNEDPETTGALRPPEFPAWPPVSWELLGASEMMAARDVEVRADLQRAQAEGTVHYGAGDVVDARRYYSDGAARMGLEAWHVAVRLRAQAGVEAFTFPEVGYDFVQPLRDHVQMLADREREYEEQQEKKRSRKKPKPPEG